MTQQALILSSDGEIVRQIVDIMEGSVFRTYIVNDFQSAIHLLIQKPFELIITQIDPPWEQSTQGIYPLHLISGAAILVISQTKLDELYYAIVDKFLHWPEEATEIVEYAHAAIRHRDNSISAGKNVKRLYCRGLVLFPAYHKVFYYEHEIVLSTTEYRLLYYLMENLDQILSREQILEKIWKQQSTVESDNTVQSNICRIRRKLSKITKETFLETIRGSGYRFTSIPMQVPGQVSFEDVKYQ